MKNEFKRNEFYLKEKYKLINKNYSLSFKFNNFQIKFIKYNNIKYVILIVVFWILVFIRNNNNCGNVNYIHIAMSLNNNYTYPIMVSITSILLNSNKNTFIQFHILSFNRE